jgi:hypothetical protein
MRQTPGHSGGWEGISFTLDPVERCDYVIVLNHARAGETISVSCPPHNVWAIIQEPPNEILKPMHLGIDIYHRIYTPGAQVHGKRYIQGQTGLPWHVGRDYDFLVSCAVPQKSKNLSWITSSLSNWEGHRTRLDFLERIKGKLEFDLFGRGFLPIADKWDGLAPYRYSLAIENFCNEHYWSEKIADCFLSWTMPVYYGCSRISEYFPRESMVLININNPMDAIKRIKEAFASDRWTKNLDAIAAARQLVLKRYQLFPLIVSEVKKDRERFWSRFRKAKMLSFDGYNRIPPASNTKNSFRERFIFSGSFNKK